MSEGLALSVSNSRRFYPLEFTGSTTWKGCYRLLESGPLREIPMTAQSILSPLFARFCSPATPLVDLSVASSPVQVQAVNSRTDLAEFVELPKHLHRPDRNWVAPLDAEVKKFLDPQSHPFYQHGQAQAFLARREGQTVGRVLVSDDPAYNARHGANVGCFGMFECINDHRTSRVLLDRASAWLRARGRTEIMGPIDYSTNYPTGLLVDGFGTPPSFMMNHQPRYYERLLNRYGMEPAKDMYAWWFGRENKMDARWSARVSRLAERFGVTVRSLNMDDFDAEMQRCRKIYHAALEENWGFVKMSELEFDHLARNLRKLAVPDLVQFAQVGGEPVGISITLPNLNEAIGPLGGRLTTAGVPIGLARLACRLRKIKTGRLLVLGVMPGYRRRGVAESLILETMRQGVDQLGYEGAELSWTLEDNTLVNRMIERIGGRRYKTYRIYSKELSASLSAERNAA